MDMHPLKDIKEVQRLDKQIIALGKYMSCSTREYLPFYYTLKVK